MPYRLPSTSMMRSVTPGRSVVLPTQPLPPQWAADDLNPQPLPPGPPPPDLGIIAILIG